MQGLAMAMLMLQCAVLAAAHPVNSAIWFASAGLRLRGRMDASLAHTSFQTLNLRGGGEVPGVHWSQRQDTVMIKVEIPAGETC